MNIEEIRQFIAEGKIDKVLDYINYLKDIQADYEVLKSKIVSLYCDMKIMY